MASYEFWLTDDAGNRTQFLKDLYYFSYTRSTNGLGTINFGMPFAALGLIPYFRPDWRVEVWRSAAYGVAMRREDVFMLRQSNVYTREDDVQVLQFYGRNGIDLLHRRHIIQPADTAYSAKSAAADDMMKAIVRQQMLYGSTVDKSGTLSNTRAWPQGEFTVQADGSLGPTVTRAFAGRKLYDVLKELKDNTFQLNTTASTNRRIYFDVVPVDISPSSNPKGSPLGWQFRTYADLRGADRTGGIEFSLENENMTAPTFTTDELEEVSSVAVNGNGSGSTQVVEVVDDAARVLSSRWNRIENVINASNETTTSGLQDAGRAELYNKRPVEKLDVTLLSTPGGPTTPRSLYGVDWDLGDLIRVSYAERQFNVEVGIVYVAVDENGKENITGRNEIQA